QNAGRTSSSGAVPATTTSVSRSRSHPGQTYSRRTTGPSGLSGAHAPVIAAYSELPTVVSATPAPRFHPPGAVPSPAPQAAQRARRPSATRTTSTDAGSRPIGFAPRGGSGRRSGNVARARRAARRAARAAIVASASTVAPERTTPYTRSATAVETYPS